MALVFQKTLVRADDEIRSYQIQQRSAAGWESSEQGHGVAERHCHTDWHRVERDLARFTREIAELHRQGWRDAQDS
jgi:hypothetical protein